jgi:hypothetical protein
MPHTRHTHAPPTHTAHTARPSLLPTATRVPHNTHPLFQASFSDFLSGDIGDDGGQLGIDTFSL